MGIDNDCPQAPTTPLGFYPLAGPAKLCGTGVKRAAGRLLLLEPTSAPHWWGGGSGSSTPTSHHEDSPRVQRGPLEWHRLQFDVLFPIHAVHPGGRSKSGLEGALRDQFTS